MHLHLQHMLINLSVHHHADFPSRTVPDRARRHGCEHLHVTRTIFLPVPNVSVNVLGFSLEESEGCFDRFCMRKIIAMTGMPPGTSPRLTFPTGGDDRKIVVRPCHLSITSYQSYEVTLRSSI
jgi:hypothetical protein